MTTFEITYGCGGQDFTETRKAESVEMIDSYVEGRLMAGPIITLKGKDGLDKLVVNNIDYIHIYPYIP